MPRNAALTIHTRKGDEGYGVVEIRETTAAEVLANAGLMHEHWATVSRIKDKYAASPDAERFRLLEAAGLLLVVGAFDDDKLIGYAATIISRHMHYDFNLAANDALYLAEAYRGTRAGLGLIRETERLAKARGADMITWHAKPGTPLDALLPRLSYGLQDHIYLKGLSDGN